MKHLAEHLSNETLKELASQKERKRYLADELARGGRVGVRGREGATYDGLELIPALGAAEKRSLDAQGTGQSMKCRKVPSALSVYLSHSTN